MASLVSDEENGFSPPGSVESAADVSHPPSLLNSPSDPSLDNEGDGPARKKAKVASNVKDDKLCGVCGDKALGCNFDAVSCESCKAFFRRNALKDKKTKCLFNGSCTIDINTRRFCPHCRLQKCFTVGMRSDLILGDDQRKRRMDKVKANRQKRSRKSDIRSPETPQMLEAPLTPQPGPATPATPATPDPLPLIISPMTPQPLTPQAPLSQPHTPQAVEPVDQKWLSVVATAAVQQQQQLQQQEQQQQQQEQQQQQQPVHVPILINLENPMAAFNAQVAAAFNMTVPSPTTITTTQAQNDGATTVTTDSNNLLSTMKLAKLPTNYDGLNYTAEQCFVRRLTNDESSLLSDLQQVYDLSFTVDLEPLIHIKQLDPSLNQLVNQSSITVLRIIKFAKRLEEFVRLPQECQIGILKGTWIHILLLRSVSLYDCERDVWVTPKGDIPTEILKNATGYIHLHDSHVNYCKSLKGLVGDDLAIVIILLVTVLFSPEGPHVTVREVISNIQDKYLLLLKHYLESKYTYIRAADIYPALMSKMKELKELAESHGKYLLDINPREIEPIMLEILDLK